jgi:hypothetical protein
VLLPPILALVALLAPPLVHLLERGRARRASESAGSPGAARLANEVANLRQALERARRELQEISGAPFLEDSGDWLSRRYRVTWVDVLPFADPSPLRDALWVSLRRDGGPGEDCAVLFAQALAGRLVELPASLPLARVQTLRDPLFRVRCRCGQSEGILWGTDRADSRGRALLEVHHLSPADPLPPGARVFTRGGDGIYPPGVLIGEVVAPEEGPSPHPMVRAAVDPRPALRLMLVRDLARQDVARRDQLREEARR